MQIPFPTSAILGTSCAIASVLLGSITPPDISGYIQTGGTALAVSVMYFGWRNERTERIERQKRLDAIHDEQVKASAAAAEARVRLADSIEKLSEKINK